MPGMMTSQDSLVERQGNCHLQSLENTYLIKLFFFYHILDDQTRVLFKTSVLWHNLVDSKHSLLGLLCL